MTVRYHLRFPDGSLARGSDPSLSFRSSGAEGLAAELQEALRSPALFERWRDLQDEPDDVDPAMGAVDPGAVVTGEQDDLAIRLTATTSISGAVFKQRLRMLAGSNWQLRDVTDA